jgi:NAD(P)-dependent dehydrogenase (short-subunit alcohol dehydrogenase family)
MPRRLSESVVVVTGASSGIGRATALEFARRGSTVVAAARREPALKELAADGDYRGTVTAVGVDVTNEDDVKNLARHAVEDHGRIDVWVNNAAVTAFGRVDDVPIDVFERVWAVNVIGYLYGIRSVLPYMREQGSGVIVNVSSIVGRVGQPYATAYTMTKFAIRALSIGLRQELLVDDIKGIDVCTVMPGSIDTPLFQNGANYTGWKTKPMSPVYPAEKVAKAIVSCARSPRPEVFVGGAARTMNLQAQLAPRVAERILARQVDSDHFDKEVYAERSAGNLYQPAGDRADVSGGWGGKRSLNLRRLALLGIGTAGVAWMLKRPD